HDTRPSALSRYPAVRESHRCRSLSSETPPRASQRPVQFARIPPTPASCPKHRFPPADRGPSLSSFPTAPAVPLHRFVAPPPSSVSKRSRPSFRPALPAYLSRQRRASCTPPHQYCRSPPPRSPQSATLAPPPAIPRQPSRSAGTPARLDL